MIGLCCVCGRVCVVRMNRTLDDSLLLRSPIRDDGLSNHDWFIFVLITNGPSIGRCPRSSTSPGKQVLFFLSSSSSYLFSPQLSLCAPACAYFSIDGSLRLFSYLVLVSLISFPRFILFYPNRPCRPASIQQHVPCSVYIYRYILRQKIYTRAPKPIIGSEWKEKKKEERERE